MCNQQLNNYEKAEQEAKRVEELILSTLQAGKNFRVEAGAGSGKTFSLIKVIEWIQKNKWSYYQKRKQNVVCITYTNAAVEVIAERLKDDSFIIPSTIHSFAWNAINNIRAFCFLLLREIKNINHWKVILKKSKRFSILLGIVIWKMMFFIFTMMMLFLYFQNC